MAVNNEKVTAVISGTAMWAKIKEPDDNGKYTLDIVVTDEEATRLEGLRLSPAKLEDKKTLKSYEDAGHPGKVFRAKTNATNAQTGEAMRPPRVVDASKEEFDGLIGNGSKVNVLVTVADYNYKGKKGVNAYLQKVQVVELVPYVAKATVDSEFDVVEGGFTTSDDNGTDPLSDDTDGPF